MKTQKPQKKESGKSMSLYEIDRNLSDLLVEMVNPETGEIDEEIEKKLGGLEQDREEKIFGCIRWIKNQRATATALKAEAEQMTKRAKVFENSAKRCEQYLDSLTERENDKGLGFEAGELKWSKSSKTVVHIIEMLPSTCIKIERKAILTNLKKLIEEGKIEKEVAEIETNYNLKVK